MSKKYRCECGELDNNEECQWVGDIEQMVVVEYMPRSTRDRHLACLPGGGGIGVYPHNGSIRALLCEECAELAITSDTPMFCKVVHPDNKSRYYSGEVIEG